MPLKPAPLNTAFFATSIIGFLISSIYIFPKSTPWGTAFSLIFILMFLASVISMRKAKLKSQLPKNKK